MKIELELEEIVLLQSVTRGLSAGSRSRETMRLLNDLGEAGLVRWDRDVFGPIFITPLGQRILRENSPYIDPDNRRGVILLRGGCGGFGLSKFS